MSVTARYKIQGTCPPFTVALYSGATLIGAPLVTSQTGTTFSIGSLSYNGNYHFCATDGDNLGSPYCIYFKTPSAPSVLSVNNTPPPPPPASNSCFTCGSIVKSLPIPSPYTGLTYICLCVQNTGTAPVLSRACSRLLCNNTVICNLNATSTGTAKISGTTIPVVIDSDDTLTYDLTTCVCAVGNVSFASMSIVGTSPVDLYKVSPSSGTTDSEANLSIGSPSCYSIVKNNYVPAAKTVATCRITQANFPLGVICTACGSLTISPILGGGETMSIRISADTRTVGAGASCVEFYCCAGGAFPMTLKCCVGCNQLKSVVLPVTTSDIYCYNLWTASPSAGSCGLSRFKITGVTGTGGYTPQICSTKKEDGISICVAATTAAPKAINLNQTSYNGGDGTSLTCRTFCLSSTPAMIAGECYCVCIDGNLSTSGQATGSCSEICVTCNGVRKMCCKIVIPVQSCALPSVSFMVDNIDYVCIYSLACVTYSGCGFFAGSAVCLCCVTSVAGSFCRGTCTCRNSITN